MYDIVILTIYSIIYNIYYIQCDMLMLSNYISNSLDLLQGVIHNDIHIQYLYSALYYIT